MFINFYSLLILEMGMFKKNLMFKLVFVYDVQRCKQWIECVVFEIFKFESFNPYICVYVWFDFLTIDHCSMVAVNLCIRINTGTYTSMMSACNLVRDTWHYRNLLQNSFRT